jgi:hypothetical protein
VIGFHVVVVAVQRNRQQFRNKCTWFPVINFAVITDNRKRKTVAANEISMDVCVILGTRGSSLSAELSNYHEPILSAAFGLEKTFQLENINISVMFWFTIFKLIPLNIRKSHFSQYCDFFLLHSGAFPGIPAFQEFHIENSIDSCAYLNEFLIVRGPS